MIVDITSEAEPIETEPVETESVEPEEVHITGTPEPVVAP